MEPESWHSSIRTALETRDEFSRTRRQHVIFDGPKIRLISRRLPMPKHSSSVHQFEGWDSVYDPWMIHNDRTRIDFDPLTESFSATTSRKTPFFSLNRYLFSLAFHSFLQYDILHHTLLHSIKEVNVEREWKSTSINPFAEERHVPENRVSPKVITVPEVSSVLSCCWMSQFSEWSCPRAYHGTTNDFPRSELFEENNNDQGGGDKEMSR